MTEYFKGIEFVRISSLPEDQKQMIWKSFQQDKIIKIVRDQALLNDCILYNDYINWLNDSQNSTPKIQPAQAAPSSTPAKSLSGFSKLAFE